VLVWAVEVEVVPLQQNTQQRLLPEHVGGVDGSQPVAVGAAEVVARSSAQTLNEGNPLEIFQTGSR